MSKKYIINVGQSRNDNQLLTRMPAILEAPFDGMALQGRFVDAAFGGTTQTHVHISEAQSMSWSTMSTALSNFNSMKYGHFKHNLMRINLAEPGTANIRIDSQLQNVLDNAGTCARIAYNIPNCTGIFLDLEAYSSSIFWKHTSLPGTKTFAESQARYRYFGELFMIALQNAYPTLAWVVIAVSYEQVRDVTAANRPSNTYGLLPDFLNGLHQGARGDVRLVNFLEDGYSNQTVADFWYDLNIQKPENVPYLDSMKYNQYHAHGMATYVDYTDGPAFDFSNPNNNHHTPAGFENNLRLILDNIDWAFVYNETPQWPGMGLVAGNDMPRQYLDALRRVRASYP